MWARDCFKEAEPDRMRRIPFSVWVIAVLAALLHMAPYWRAQKQAGPGWSFTGNISVSPDFIQYRSWFRQAQEAGVIVENKLTSEPNRPHIPVLPYYATGKISSWTNWAPEFVFAYAGSLFAFGLTIVLFWTVREFLTSTHAVWWVFLSLMIGGGLGAHCKILANLQAARDNALVNKLIIVPVESWPIFEDYRSHYVFITLFDSHFTLAWLLGVMALLALYLALQRFSPLRLGTAVFLFGFSTLMHVYEGVLWIVVTASIGYVLQVKKLLDRKATLTLAACGLAAAACLGWVAYLHAQSGIPMPIWRSINILISILLMAYPLAWGILAWGLAGYWRKAGLKECFLLGWALGCVLVTLSGPFYQFPDRGTMTLPVPIFIMAGAIYFSYYKRVSARAALIAVLVMGATPVWALAKLWVHTGRLNPEATYMFNHTAHREMVDLLKTRAGSNDILMAQPPNVLWLAPEYPGRHYAGHFALTVNYDGKLSRMDRFFESTPEEQASFLRQQRIRFLYVDAKKDASRLGAVPGLNLLKSASIGALYEYNGG